MLAGDDIHDPVTVAKLRMYKMWRKFKVTPSALRKERNKDIDECLRIDEIVEQAIKMERRRQEAVAEAKARG